MPLNLDYYYGTEGEQYSFYRIPKTLFTDPCYKDVSMEAKVLYGLLLDRMSLSVRNGWMDKLRRIYIYFTQEDAMALMCCGKDKITRLFRELDQSGIGLIERKKQGQGRPTRIYVKNFTPSTESDQTPADPEPAQPPADAPQTAEVKQSRPPEIQPSAPLEMRSQLRKLRKHHPELWARLMDMDKRAREQFGPGPLGQFKPTWSVAQLEARFAKEEAKGK